MLRHFVAGQDALQQLRTKYPETFEAVVQRKAEQEHFLTTKSMLSTGAAIEVVQETLKETKTRYTDEVPGITTHTAEVLVHEAVADWLIRCPLDFIEKAKS